MLAGANSKPCVLPRLRVLGARWYWWTPTIQASDAANVGRLPKKTLLSAGIAAPVAVNWTAITTRRSTCFWPGRGPRRYGVVEAPGFSRGGLHGNRNRRHASVDLPCCTCSAPFSLQRRNCGRGDSTH